MFGRRRFPIGRRRGRGTNPFIILMAMRLLQQIHRLPVKPPITLVLIGVQSAIHLFLNLPFSIYGMNPRMIWERSEFMRLITGQLLHADDYHLYYNMASFLYKGVKLETSRRDFGILVCVLLLGTGIIHTILAFMLYATHLYDEAYFTTAVGFSGVIFALKTVLNFNSPTMSRVFGISLPTKHAAWLELVIASFLNPNASFLGHLSGILAGMIWLEFKQDSAVSRWIRTLFQNTFSQRNRDTSPQQSREEQEMREAMRRSREEQEMREAIRRSQHDYSSTSYSSSSSSSSSSSLTADQLRRARLRRFKNN